MAAYTGDPHHPVRHKMKHGYKPYSNLQNKAMSKADEEKFRLMAVAKKNVLEDRYINKEGDRDNDEELEMFLDEIRFDIENGINPVSPQVSSDHCADVVHKKTKSDFHREGKNMNEQRGLYGSS